MFEGGALAPRTVRERAQVPAAHPRSQAQINALGSYPRQALGVASGGSMAQRIGEALERTGYLNNFML